MSLQDLVIGQKQKLAKMRQKSWNQQLKRLFGGISTLDRDRTTGRSHIGIAVEIMMTQTIVWEHTQMSLGKDVGLNGHVPTFKTKAARAVTQPSLFSGFGASVHP